jgi:hypothetical protein
MGADHKPMGYGRAPKMPSYNLQSVVDVESGLIVHHDVYNDANDSHMLHPVSVAAKKVLEVDQIQVLTDGGYSNAEEIARCEREGIEVAAPIKRGAMNSDHFRPAQFVYDYASDTIRCPAGETLRPSGLHTRNRAIRYRTSACPSCRLKPRCTPGVQRTIHRLVDQGALDRMEARIYADPGLMTIRRCTVEHPFGTIKRMSGGGRFLTRGLRAVKAEAALSILAFNILHAVEIGLAFDEVGEEIWIVRGQGAELVEERLLGLQLLAQSEARVACHESLQSARAWRDATHRGIAAAPASPDAGNSMWGAGNLQTGAPAGPIASARSSRSACHPLATR